MIAERGELRELLHKAFTAPFSTHRWSSTRGRNHWLDLEGWQDALAGPLSAIRDRGGCGYVYAREDQYFSGVDGPTTLRLRLLEWHLRLLAGVDAFVPVTLAENEDLAYMRSVASLMHDVVERGCRIEQERWEREE